MLLTLITKVPPYDAHLPIYYSLFYHFLIKQKETPRMQHPWGFRFCLY